jgi:protein-disulfide isomerase/uncharacterized membrane protein
MTRRILNILLRVALLVSLLASAALFVDYSTATPSFCGVRSGCAAVKTSAFSAVAGIPLPHLGLGVFSGLYGLAIWASRPRHYKVLAGFAGVAGLGAVAFIGLQLFVIKAICQWCMAVDTGAIVAAISAILLTRPSDVDDPSSVEEPRPLRFLWAGLALAVIAAPLFWQHPAPQVTVPEPIAAHYEDGKVNVVMFTDFECPFCRRMHPVVEELREAHPGRVNLVRLMRPLRGHPGAEPAALAYLCTPAEQRDAMADRLYGGSSEELTPKGVVAIGKELGLDPGDLGRCMVSKETKDRLDEEIELFKVAELRGLPSLFVNTELVQGADIPAFESATARAFEGDGGGSGTPVVWMFVFVGLLTAAVVAVTLRAGQALDEGTEAAA